MKIFYCHHVTSLDLKTTLARSGSQQRKRRVPSRQTCIAQNIESRGDLSLLLPVFPRRGKQNKNGSQDTATTRLENINWEIRSNCVDHEGHLSVLECGSYHRECTGSIKWDIVDKVLWYQYLHCGVIDIRVSEWTIRAAAVCRPGWLSISISL